MLILLRVGLLELLVLFYLLLLEHFGNFVEQLIYVLSSLCRDAVVRHLVLLDQILQPLLLEISRVSKLVLLEVVLVAADDGDGPFLLVLAEETDPVLQVVQRRGLCIMERGLETSKTRTQQTASFR